MHVESLGKPHNSTGVLASLVIQQAFSKPCLVNLISKVANLVLYLSVYQVDSLFKQAIMT